ncbi:hypothetical protein H4219_003054 [Mycoemilia scoparia]|uniref:Uncharacterized protein n=1 Tax=Mycoemilia scoparia TaxID=417184 RepID=A0A9W8A1M2_9FUNG|nr:hypothetical protein H4219_003054 [Mycoemilia scoparia]
MVISDDLPLIAVGSGSYDTNLYFVSALFEDGQNRDGLPNFMAPASFASKFPIYSLSFKNDLLITGTERGTSILYKVDRHRLLGIDSGNGESEGAGIVQCLGAYRNKSARGMDSAVPGHHIPTRRIHCVEFSPPFAGSNVGGNPNLAWPPQTVASDSSLFLSCLYGVVNIFDANNRQRALRSEKVSVQPVFHASWNPHSPASMIATGGVDGGVSVLDLRKHGRAVVWRASSESVPGISSGMVGSSTVGHGVASINDVAWSPFLPYWLSAATDEGEVHLWDLRYAPGPNGAPVGKICHQPHRGSITSICWSKMYFDQISTGTSDHRWQLHSLSSANNNDAGFGVDQTSQSHKHIAALKTGHRLESRTIADWTAGKDFGAIVSIATTSSQPEVLYSLSSCGDLYAYRMTHSSNEHLTTHRFSKETHPEEYALESKIYGRDISSASKGLLSVVNRYLEKHPGGQDPATRVMSLASEIRDLCDLFRVKPSIPFDEWTLAPMPKNNGPFGSVASGSTPNQSSMSRFSARLSLSGRPDLLAPLGMAISENNGSDGKMDSNMVAALEEVLDDLQVFGYGLPPGYQLDEKVEKDKNIWKALTYLNMVKLRLRLEDLIKMANDSGPNSQQGNSGDGAMNKDPDAWQKLVERQPQLAQYIRICPNLYDVNLLKNIVKVVLPHDCLCGLRMGLTMCRTYLELQAKAQKFEDGEIAADEMDEGSFSKIQCANLNALVHVLLFPTIFDPDNTPTAPAPQANGEVSENKEEKLGLLEKIDVAQVRDRVRACLEVNPSILVEMVQLEIDVQNTVLQSGDQAQVAQSIIKLMNEHSGKIRNLKSYSQFSPTMTSTSPGSTISSSSGNRRRFSPNGNAVPENESLTLRQIMRGIHPDFPATTTFSAGAVRLYLNALIHGREFDTYLINAQWWWTPETQNTNYVISGINAFAGYSLGRILYRQTVTIVAPRFKKQLDHFIGTIKKNIYTPKPEVYQDILVKLLRLILLCRRSIPMKDVPIKPSLLFDSFKMIFDSYFELIAEMCKADDVSMRNSVVTEAETLHSRLEETIVIAKRLWTQQLETELEKVLHDPVRPTTYSEFFGVAKKYTLRLLDFVHMDD